jgi:hypothetical protein
MSSGMAEISKTNYFKVGNSELQAQMRLGGVTDDQFKALMNPKVKHDTKWALKRLQRCHVEHDICTELRVSRRLPNRLLKFGVSTTELVQLVDGETLEDVPYVALSYCWGGDHKMALRPSTESILRAGIAADAFSLTVQDAMEVCRQLGVFYIWVDALCILQGHMSDEWKEAASSIQHIYGNAHFTLSIAASDSVSDGFLKPMLPGKYPLELYACKLEDNFPYPARKGLAEVKANSPCAGRGWIFQEELLSPRILYWTRHGLFWSCSKLEDAENGTADSGGKDDLFSNIAIPETLNPHTFRTSRDPLLLWDDMITMYSVRDFKFHTDRLPAVDGLADIISRATGEEYVLGLWISRLPAQLLWVVKGIAEPLEYGETKPPPTWTWASIAPRCKIEMPKQASSRARLIEVIVEGTDTILHLSGRLRPLTKGLQRLDQCPEPKKQGPFGRELPELKNDPNRWAVHGERLCIYVCLSWNLPIIIWLDRGLPDSFDDLVCFEINYLGFLLLRPTTTDGTYERVGCAPYHREARFFADAPIVNLKLV